MILIKLLKTLATAQENNKDNKRYYFHNKTPPIARISFFLILAFLFAF